MKKLKIIALLICLCAGFTFAEEYYWPRSYYVSAGFGAQVSKGDFNERAITGKDSAGVKGDIHPPALEFVATPDLMVGVNLGAFSLGLGFQYWTSEQVMAGFPDESYRQDTRIWRASLEVTYNLFWPDFFQIGLGLGYSYSSVKAENAAIFGTDAYDAEFMGSAVAFIANIHYYITDHLSMVPALKFYENWFKNVHCSRIDNNDLDPYLWQTFVLATVSIQYQF
ncbi:MAG: hypothetical protein SPL21_10885 [Fibrobacter sp.]|jgi:hypothetical protein|nr:hypothetical protein [Fibrobacter sp.]